MSTYEIFCLFIIYYSVAENRSFCVGSEEEAVGSRADQAAVRVRAGRERAGM